MRGGGFPTKLLTIAIVIIALLALVVGNQTSTVAEVNACNNVNVDSAECLAMKEGQKQKRKDRR